MFWTPGRLGRLNSSILISLALACVVSAFSPQSEKSLLFRGDFPAFYTAAHLAGKGRLNEIYDEEIQSDLQQTFWPSLENTYYAYSYPPYVAQLIAPLSRLEPRAAKVFFSALMFLSLIASLRLGAQYIPPLGENRLGAFTAAVSFAPLFIGLLGGQNATLSMLCFTAAGWGLSRGKAGSELAAGVALGIWFFKPHFALVVLLGAALFSSCRLLVGAAAIGLCYFALTASSLGILWPRWWIEAAIGFAAEDAEANRFQMLSLWSLYTALPGALGSGGITLLCQGAVAAAAAWIAWQTALVCRHARGKSANEKLSAFLLLAPAAILFSPHTLFYELAWLFPSAAYYLRAHGDRRVWIVVALNISAALLALWRENFFIQPLIIYPLGVFLIGRGVTRAATASTDLK